MYILLRGYQKTNLINKSQECLFFWRKKNDLIQIGFSEIQFGPLVNGQSKNLLRKEHSIVATLKKPLTVMFEQPIT